ncbi:MAG: hypothetical protein AVO38_02090 [delta proteobacterium ML8_D]|nr:MAG: hypothetical protein AVO38_02090 [delta proteobacterium ML8_D]
MPGREQGIFVGLGIFQLDPAVTGEEIPLIIFKFGNQGAMVGQHGFNFIRGIGVIIFSCDLSVLT